MNCPHFARNWIGVDSHNLGNLLSFKFLARAPDTLSSAKWAGWHLVLTIPKAKDRKAFGSFINSKKVYQSFDECLETLSYMYDDQHDRTFHAAFKNIIKYFETKARSILLLPPEVILDMLSTAMLEFSRVLRDPTLNGISRVDLFKEFNRRVAIDEAEFYIDALMQARQSDALAVSKRASVSVKTSQFPQRSAMENRTSTSSVFPSRCFAAIAYELKISSLPCKFPACRFSHSKLPVPLPVALKKDIVTGCNGIRDGDFKKRLVDAVNALPSV